MKKLLLLCTLLGSVLPLMAQKVYFIYIESELRSPFYVKRGEQVYSSSSSGYLILSKLPDSTYTLMVGPGANMPEVRFEVALNGKDRGFLLKKFNDSWGLFDMQSLELLRPAGSGNGLGTGTRLREDRFTAMLSQAAADTSLLYQPVTATAATPVIKKQEEKPASANNTALVRDVATATASVPAKTETTVAATTETDSVKEMNTAAKVVDTPLVAASATLPAQATVDIDSVDSAKVVPVFKRSVISRYAESSTVEGYGLVYTDKDEGAVDTIRLTIPNPKFAFPEPAATPEVTAPAKADKPAYACKEQAGEKEFFKLRRNLAAIDSEADMTGAAVAAFRKRCYSVEQVKSLSSLFLTQAGKYAFLEAAYPYVYNRDQFATLQSELFEPAYLARFKALTTN